jgi:hypothetical protein
MGLLSHEVRQSPRSSAAGYVRQRPETTLFYQVIEEHWPEIMASQPTAINAYLFAERYNAAQALATTLVFLSTSFSLLSIPVLLYFYQAGFFQ